VFADIATLIDHDRKSFACRFDISVEAGAASGDTAIKPALASFAIRASDCDCTDRSERFH
jgi:hypothetical protein